MYSVWMISEQFISYIMARTSLYIQWDDVYFVLDLTCLVGYL